MGSALSSLWRGSSSSLPPGIHTSPRPRASAVAPNWGQTGGESAVAPPVSCFIAHPPQQRQVCCPRRTKLVSLLDRSRALVVVAHDHRPSRLCWVVTVPTRRP